MKIKLQPAKKIVLSVLVVLVAFFVTKPVLAQNNSQRVPRNVVLPKDQVVNQDYFAAGDNVTLSGTVNGDAYVAGGTIFIDGTINGDLLAAGGNITVTGKVTGNARVAGGQIQYSGTVGRNSTIAGGNITLSDNAKPSGNVVTAGGNVTILSPVSGNITAATGNLTLNNSVGGNVDAAVGSLILNSNTRIAKKLTYWSNTTAQVQQGAQVLGATEQKPSTYFTGDIKTPTARDVTNRIAQVSFYWRLVSLISYLLVGFLLISFWPSFARTASSNVLNRFGSSLGHGFLIIVLTPIIFILLLITILGIPAALIFTLLMVIAGYLAPIVVSYAIGQKILGDSVGRRFLALLVGLVIYELILLLIPIFGWVVGFVIMMLGLGALFLTFRETRQEVVVARD